jgi:hypothetical protein
MRGRWVSLLCLLPLAHPTSAHAVESNPRTSPPPATRADVLAGRATDRQTVELLRASLEAAGGTAAASEEEAPADAYPLLQADLDGDGDEEVIVQQYLDIDPPYPPGPPLPPHRYLAVDDRGLLWRHRVSGSFVIGLLPGDFAPAPGTEVVSLTYHYQPFPSPPSLELAVLGAEGLLWERSITDWWFELNGLVEADTDALSEFALSVWSNNNRLSIHAIDGQGGDTISVTRSSLGPTGASEGFVTDGSSSGPDESIFLTRIAPALSYLERYRLSDGQLITRDVAVSDARWLSQGPDYTGDGRRDAFAGTYFYEYGVFDGASMRLAWSHEEDEDPLGGSYVVPYVAGDINKDGGEELCVITDSPVFGNDIHEGAAGARCHAGRTGAEIWEASLKAEAEFIWPMTRVDSDLDGDELPDPILTIYAYNCGDDNGEEPCTTTREETLAVSGKDALPLWPADVEPGLAWWVSSSDFDGVPGDDVVEPWWFGSEEPSSPTARSHFDAEPDARVSMLNGLHLARAWEGVIDTGDLPGNVGWGLDADVDGDGDAEGVFSAFGYERRGDDTVLHSFVAALDHHGRTLWSFEL